ncbi:THxN family PEP-CTERM protein [Alkalimonas sp.]|uniref:THxN family PEP-CTERM protein n=1 Tax=Alkalimonas sp. TaxID=1872453 RepID=UPI00263B4102|nr:THxN family PEP-CTERM protein [Alkalimonas sp.]MCC5825703.1 PEP-CTERM sorting domain-containing protein [Alkalimonas sp.]
MKTQSKTTLGLLAGAACLLSAQAFAAPIASFDFQTSGGFYFGSVQGGGSFGTCNAGGPATCALTLSDPDTLSSPGGFQTYNQVSWGTPHSSNTTGEQSSLAVNHQNGSITTDGTWFTIDEFIHTNNVLNADGGWMTSVGLYGFFELLSGEYSLGAEVPLLFEETVNATPCPPGTPGSILNPVCPDYYLTFPLTASDSFIVGDYKYNISFQFVAGPGAVVEEIEIDGLTWTRIWTQEGNPGQSRVFTQASITFEPIPTPGTLALFGLSLVGMGAYARRRKQS